MDLTRGRRKSQTQVGLQEGRHKAAAGAIDMDGNVQAGSLLKRSSAALSASTFS